MLRSAVKNVLAHKLRLVTTAVAVMLSVALMAGTLVLTDTVRTTFDDLFASVYRGTDAVVRAKASFDGPQGSGVQRGRIPASLLPTVRAVPGVAHADGGVFGFARLIGHDGKALGNPATGAPTLGTAWPADQQLNPFRLVAGSPPRGATDVVIDRKSANDGHLAVGDTTTVLVNGPPLRVRVTGIAKFGSADSPGGATVVIFTLASAQRYVATPGTFDSIDVVAARGVTQAQVTARIRAVLPAGVEALTGKKIISETQGQVRKSLSFFNTFMLIFAIVAVLVGAFMMFNTFAITVAQRTRENGLLRALGASRRQLRTAVIVEALLLGLVASLVGVAAGVAVAFGLKGLMNALGFEIPASGLTVLPSSLLLAFGVGMAITLAAAWSPARKASRVAPMAAMQMGVVGSSGYGSRQRMLVGALVLAGGVTALLLGLFAGVSHPVQVVGAGAVLVFFGVSILGRTVALPLSRAIGWLLPRVRGVTGALARENAMRNPKRTAASASALMIGVGLVGFITIFVSSTKASIDHAINRTFTGDIVLDTGALVGGVDPSLARRVGSLPGIESAVGLRFGVARVGSTATFVQAADPVALSRIVDLGIHSGSFAALGPDAIAVYRTTASDRGWRVGSRVRFQSPTGVRMLRVAAIYDQNTQLGNYFLGLSAFERSFSNQYDRQVLVKRAAGVSSARALASIRTVLRDYPGVKALDRAGYVAEQTKPVDRLLALIYALLGLAILIALLGIANTLALSIGERVREIGLLRAVGMTRGQLRSMIRWESVIIALQGAVLGLAIGVFFGWALVRALRDQGIDVFSVPITSLLVVMLLASLAGMAAAVAPGRRAARLDVLRAVVSD